MLKITYLSRINFFSGKAHVYTITKTCSALSRVEGLSVVLVSTDDSLMGEEKKDEFIVSLNSFSNKFKTSPNFFVYNLGTFFANISLLKYVWKNRKNMDIVYFRDRLILPVVLFAKYILGKKIVYESHYILTKKFGQWLTEKSVAVSDGVVCIAAALKNYYQKFNKNIIVSFCASSEKEKFQTDLPASHFRKKVGFPENLFYLVYTGNIDVTGNGDSYGVEDVVRALPFMSADICFAAVGKKTEGKHSLEFLAESLGLSGRFKCVPWVSREKAVDYILAADLLIIPKSGAKPGNSPTKMFEYLAAGRPIVAADTPAIGEVLRDGINASLVDYENPKAWAEAVIYLKENPEYGKKIAARAEKDADLYTWKNRGKTIGNFIKKIYA